MNTKHTPGPWRVDDSTGLRIESLGERCGGTPTLVPGAYGTIVIPDRRKEAEANARLMAAAPELLTALELLLDVSDIAPEANCSCHLSPPCNDCVEWGNLREIRSSAMDAIAKATGAA